MCAWKKLPYHTIKWYTGDFGCGMRVPARVLRTGLFLGTEGGAEGLAAGTGADGVLSRWSGGDRAQAVVSEVRVPNVVV